VYSFQLHPKKKSLLAIGNDYGILSLWNSNRGRVVRYLVGHEGIVRAVSFNPDGKTLASGSWDKTIKLWNLHTFAEKMVLKGHQGEIR